MKKNSTKRRTSITYIMFELGKVGCIRCRQSKNLCSVDTISYG